MNIDVSVLKPLELSDVDNKETLIVIGVHEEKERVFIFTKDGEEDDYTLRVYAANKAELPLGHSLEELGTFTVYIEETEDMGHRIKRIDRICGFNSGVHRGA